MPVSCARSKGYAAGLWPACAAIGCCIGPPPLRDPKKRGRHKVHGARFAFKEPDTWGEPDEVIELEDPHWGQVRLERWNDLHEKKGADVPYDVIRASVHLEREKPPAALWLAWLAPQTDPGWADGHRRNHLAGILIAAGRLNPDCIFAKKPWAGPCRVFKAKRRVIAGPGSRRWPPG